jgi:hypothetical protein
MKSNLSEKFKVANINDLELLYSVLRETYPSNEIQIQFNWNTKEYTIEVTNKTYCFDPEVPVDLDIQVVYGDSVTGDTPLLLKKDNLVYIETIQNIFDINNKVEYPGFKMFDKEIRLEKEYSTTDYQVWSDAGWIDIKKVIRHRCDKKIYRVLTHTGCIDVTEDHSLIRDTLEPIKPKDLKVGDSLLHSFPKEFIETKYEYYKQNTEKNGLNGDCDYYKNSEHPLRNKKLEDYPLTEKEAEVWGFFMNYGKLIDTYYKCNVRKCYWYICNNDLKRLNYFKDILESVEPIKFKILDTFKSSGVYKLVPTGSLKYIVDKYRKLFYYQQHCEGDNIFGDNIFGDNIFGDKYKIVPNCILNASKEIKMAYWKGYCEGDNCEGDNCEGDNCEGDNCEGDNCEGDNCEGDNCEGDNCEGDNREGEKIAVKGKIGAQCMYYLMKSIGYNMYIYHHAKKQEIYFLNVIRNVKKDSTLVKKIIDKGNLYDYVYDLETNIGRFGAGVGKLQLKNTDSVFLKFKYNRDDFEKNRSDTFRLASVCGDNLTKDIFNRKPIELEFEKVFHPFILLTKKRYIANKFENVKDPFDLKGVDAKGIALTRRDYCLMVKKCYKKVIDTILQDTNKKKECNLTENPVISSTKVYLEYVDDIFNYKIPIDDLIVSAMLAASYKLQPGPVHVQLAEKLKKRKEEVQVGSRIPYIYIETDDLKKQKSELGEDPKYAKKHNLKYNRSCYLEQLAKPILGFYKVVLKDNQKLLDDIINYTNDTLIKCGGKKLSPSDFKIED